MLLQFLGWHMAAWIGSSRRPPSFDKWIGWCRRFEGLYQIPIINLGVRMAVQFSPILAGHERSSPGGNVLHSCIGKAFRQNLRLPADSRNFTDTVHR